MRAQDSGLGIRDQGPGTRATDEAAGIWTREQGPGIGDQGSGTRDQDHRNQGPGTKDSGPGTRARDQDQDQAFQPVDAINIHYKP